MTPAKRFGDNLRTARTRNRLSQAALGQLAGISKSEVYRLEAGTRDPRLTTILSLARALKLDVAELTRDLR
jgi:transcriptional regulator with XRE-family HTH domain